MDEGRLLRDKTLLVQAKTDSQAMDSLMQDATRFVWHIVYRYFRGGVKSFELEDIHQVGMLGFVKAVRSYDATRRGIEFTTYAGVVILNEIKMMLRQVPRVSHEVASLDRLVGIEENIPLGAVYTAHGGVGDTEEQALARISVRDTMRTMSERDRWIAYLRVCGLTQREIASVVGIRQPSVSRVLFRIAHVVNSA